MANICKPCNDDAMIERYEKGELTGLCSQCEGYTRRIMIERAHGEVTEQSERRDRPTKVDFL